MDRSDKQMTDIFAKLNDLKNVFKFAERIVPIIQSLIEFMEEMTPMLETINISIADSASQMQAGTDRICDVTNATELATTEILDLVDEIGETLNNIENQIKKKNEAKEVTDNIFAQIKEELSKTEKGKELIKHLEQIASEELKYNEILEGLSSVNEKAYRITLALQVQDITSQQLASVNHLIASVHQRLNSLISQIDENEYLVSESKNDEPERLTFDANASYTQGSKQDSVDSIIDQHSGQETKEETSSKEITSQDEIDKLFS